MAEGFATDFTNPGPDWLARLGRWVTPELLAGYRATDPTRIPTDRVRTIDPPSDDTAPAGTTDATITYDSGLQLAMRLVRSPAGWRVRTVLPMNRTP